MDKVPHTDPPIFGFKSKNKINFANSVSVEDTDFNGFEPTINLITAIKDIVEIEE